jgi:hypothetical protein
MVKLGLRGDFSRKSIVDVVEKIIDMPVRVMYRHPDYKSHKKTPEFSEILLLNVVHWSTWKFPSIFTICLACHTGCMGRRRKASETSDLKTNRRVLGVARVVRTRRML